MEVLYTVLYGVAGLGVFCIVTALVEKLGHKLVPAPPAAL